MDFSAEVRVVVYVATESVNILLAAWVASLRVVAYCLTSFVVLVAVRAVVNVWRAVFMDVFSVVNAVPSPQFVVAIAKADLTAVWYALIALVKVCCCVVIVFIRDVRY